ncbi:hypothetical protein TSUD_155070 [Trifolium subterraneum]|uniref:Uncharacterized protein n=1 Tax=Trifolium subterraneum TaxID=3900 RepID=A0A2Z6M4G2_TRISU|nr:hypothetical protein TSUD_155070 [Trifolium subterraneum]
MSLGKKNKNTLTQKKCANQNSEADAWDYSQSKVGPAVHAITWPGWCDEGSDYGMKIWNERNLFFWRGYVK